MRVVLDTNVLLAGLATHGLCESLLLLCLRNHTVHLSTHILNEVREHYVGKFKANPKQADAAITTLQAQCTLVVPVPLPPTTFADPDDIPVLGTLLAAHADCLVTGDQALLNLGHFQQIPILSPRAFYERIRTPT